MLEKLTNWLRTLFGPPDAEPSDSENDSEPFFNNRKESKRHEGGGDDAGDGGNDGG